MWGRWGRRAGGLEVRIWGGEKGRKWRGEGRRVEDGGCGEKAGGEGLGRVVEGGGGVGRGGGRKKVGRVGSAAERRALSAMQGIIFWIPVQFCPAVL